MSKTLIVNARIVNEGKQVPGSILISNERIEEIFPQETLPGIRADKVIDAGGKYLLPGVIDDQVHFREPGLTHKGDIYTESKAAVAGGVTSYMDMPNTVPQTTTQALLEEKYTRAATRSLANYSFYMGASNNNLEELLRTDPATVCGIKIFMGSSTGNMLVDNPDTLQAIFSRSNMLIAVHCEDETIIHSNIEKAKARFGDDVPIYLHPVIRDTNACFQSTSRAIQLAEKYNARLHILHLSTAAELNLLKSGIPLKEKKITAEVCVHHLLFDESDYFMLGNRIKWNPSIKSKEDKEALFQGLLEGRIDVVATDHAPHTLTEKKNTYFKAPSGGPLIQHSLVAMLELYRNRNLGPEQVVEKMCHAPAELFRIKDRGYIRKGYYADCVLVDPKISHTVSDNNVLYKCNWSPLAGMTFSSQVTHTIVNGNLVYENGTFYEKVKGKRLLFNHQVL